MSSSEAFYDRLARLYDIMNDWKARLAYEGPFIRQVLDEHGARSVLDAACGTGQHTLALRQWGYDATGADASPQMVRQAQANAATAQADAPFIVAAFDALPQVPGAPFDAVLCLGNSLPHVENAAALDAALDGMARALRPGGVLLLHNLNYDRRWVQRPRFLKLDAGVLDGRETLVWRMADYGESTVIFHTALFQKDAEGRWSVEVDSTPQVPLFRADLEARLHRLGFENVRAYGNLKGEPFDIERSDDLVLVAVR